MGPHQTCGVSQRERGRVSGGERMELRSLEMIVLVRERERERRAREEEERH